VILRRDVNRAEESMKFGPKKLGVRNKFSLGAT